MSIPSSVEELIQLIRKSGMIDETKLSSYLQRREFARGLPADAREFADDMVRDGILTYFQAEQFLLGKWRGFTIGKYKLLERVGVGGMGQVFLCEHMFMKRRVAIKVLPPAKAEQPAALGRFYREARAAGGLSHPNIVRTHDIDQDGNLHFIVMDYVDGANLLDVVKKFGPMNLERAVSYTRQAAFGLDYAFRSGIIHRDVKPGNVLIDRKGIARILDLGLARFYKDHSDQLTMKYDDKIVLGTADYVAPEQVANSHSVDIRADIYGLGATFYFLLAGHPPFPIGTVSQKLLWHRTKEPTPLQQIRPDLPDGIVQIVHRMMAKDAKARFQTPAQVMTELDAWLSQATPLPPDEEMPQLSLAATEGAEEVPESGPGEELLAGVAVGSGTVRNAPRSPAGLATPRPAPSPFAAPTISPWSSPAPSPLTAPVRTPQTAIDTAAVAEQTPSGARAGLAVASNPFAGGDLHEPGKAKTPWPVIAAAVGGAIVAGLAVAAIKFLG
ncbi:MAG TPA: serine/threonine-protein kinase [Gemmataceae bacterium]|jgi:serine/threonine protein kinase